MSLEVLKEVAFLDLERGWFTAVLLKLSVVKRSVWFFTPIIHRLTLLLSTMFDELSPVITCLDVMAMSNC